MPSEKTNNGPPMETLPLPKGRNFFEDMKEAGAEKTLSPLTTLQLNIGYACNLACRHCHLSCSPTRTEEMTKEIMEAALEVFKKNHMKVIDITGGAPEMNPNFTWLVEEACRLRDEGLADQVMVRTNLCIMDLPDYQWTWDFYTKTHPDLVASLPFYQKSVTDKQRGQGVYEDSIQALRRLNDLGYGITYPLHLVYNPAGAFMPGSQEDLEKLYKAKLAQEYGIHFTSLFTITNVPIGRFGAWLKKSENEREYLEKLVQAYNPVAAQNVMCRSMISVRYDGTIYDCDFNAALELPVQLPETNISYYVDHPLPVRKIVTGPHCYACTAGAGSSCGGATAE